MPGFGCRLGDGSPASRSPKLALRARLPLSAIGLRQRSPSKEERTMLVNPRISAASQLPPAFACGNDRHAAPSFFDRYRRDHDDDRFPSSLFFAVHASCRPGAIRQRSERRQRQQRRRDRTRPFAAGPRHEGRHPASEFPASGRAGRFAMRPCSSGRFRAPKNRRNTTYMLAIAGYACQIPSGGSRRRHRLRREQRATSIADCNR